MNVFLTGINGFLVGNLAPWLRDRGHQISGTSHTMNEKFPTVIWRLGDHIDRSRLASVELLIHAAHDFTAGAMGRNVQGTILLEQEARAAGVKRQILISSL